MSIKNILFEECCVFDKLKASRQKITIEKDTCECNINQNALHIDGYQNWKSLKEKLWLNSLRLVSIYISQQVKAFESRNQSTAVCITTEFSIVAGFIKRMT